MVHKLAIVAVIGLTASAVCMGAAAAIGGRSFGNEMDGLDLSFLGDRPRCEPFADAAATSRTLDWDGSDHVGLSVPADARYAPGNDRQLHVSGNPQMVAHLRIRDGHIELDCNGGWHGDRLQITLPGREFRRFSIAGSGNLQLDQLNQSGVKVSIAGSGSIKANGRVDNAEVHIAGAGDADLGQLATKVATVHIAGSGDTDIAPTDEADIHIAGSGDVNLHTNPRRLETHIAGSGHIRNVGNGS